MSKPTYQAAIGDEVARALGRLLATFNAVESDVATNVWLVLRLLGLQQGIGQIVTCELSFKQKLAILCSLTLKAFDDSLLLARLDEARKKLDDAEQIRNTHAHSIFGAGDSSSHTTRFKTTAKAKRGIKYSAERMMAADLDRETEKIGAAGIALAQVQIRLLDLVRPPSGSGSSTT
jgi:hypothetical protein